jgi:hypothetical protein
MRVSAIALRNFSKISDRRNTEGMLVTGWDLRLLDESQLLRKSSENHANLFLHATLKEFQSMVMLNLPNLVVEL